MKNLPSTKQLQYLVSLYETLNFSKAAQKCFVVQSTLSAGIKELENIIGAPLFERNSKNVIPTPICNKIIDYSLEILNIHESIIKLAEDEKTKNSFKIGIIPTIAPFINSTAMMEISKTNTINVKEATTKELLGDISNNQLDAAIIALPYNIGDLDYKIIKNDTLIYAYPQNITLKEIAPDQIPTEKLIMLEDGHCLNDHAADICNMARNSGNIIASNLFTLVKMVESGLGVTILPQMALDWGISSNLNINTCSIKSDEAYRKIAVVYKKNNKNINKINDFAFKIIA